MDNEKTEPYVIENFYGVYLLQSFSEIYFGRTYIGFTVDPNRRIKQHNSGTHAGGAKKTSNKGPWKMILIVHGFPNNIAALRFEWAWQNPENSRRLHNIISKKRLVKKESPLEYRLRILAEMVNVGPWNRLPLTIRWLDSNNEDYFEFNKVPPFHMPICYGPIKSKKISNSQEIVNIVESRGEDLQCFQDGLHSKPANNRNIHLNKCSVCTKTIFNLDNILLCVFSNCDLASHIGCLADLFLENGEYIPVEGNCPRCKQKILWGDLIRKLKGCNDKDIDE